MTTLQTLEMALEALEIVAREMLALRDELAERGGRPTKGIRQLLWDSSHKVYTDTAIPTAEALRQAIEQAEQAQPVVWMYQDKSTHEVRFQKHMSAFVDHSRTSEVPLYGEPLANHELQCVCGAVWCGDEMVHLPNKTPPRQPLTDEEIFSIWRKHTDLDAMRHTPYEDDGFGFARAIEAAHGIKGEA